MVTLALTATRRELLRWMLGATAAAPLPACRRTTTPTFDGSFHDPPFTAAHRIRDGDRPPVSNAPVEIPVLILGAGIAGLTAAWRLVKSGFDRFYVLDLESAPGGTARGDRSNVTGYPWGAHYLPAPHANNPALVELCHDLGLVRTTADDGEPIYREEHLAHDPETRVFFEGAWHRGHLPMHAATSADREQLARFDRRVAAFVDGVKDGRRDFALPVDLSNDRNDDLDSMTFAAWLEREAFDAPFVRYLTDYACRDDYGARPDDVSAWYGLHYFAARTKKSGEESAPFLTWPNGNARVADFYAQQIGFGRFKPYTLVAGVSPHGDGRRTVVDTWDLSRGVSTRWIAERVVFALPSFLRSHLIRGYDVPAYAPTYTPWVVANVHLSGRPRSVGFETSWDNTIFDSRSLGYVVATHQSGPAHGPTVWTHYTPITGEPKKARRDLESLSWSDAADAVVRELARTHLDIERSVHRVDVRRWGHGMVRPEPGAKTDSRRHRAATPIGPLHFAHTDLSGVGLFEEAFFHGDRAAREVLAALGAAR